MPPARHQAFRRWHSARRGTGRFRSPLQVTIDQPTLLRQPSGRTETYLITGSWARPVAGCTSPVPGGKWASCRRIARYTSSTSMWLMHRGYGPAADTYAEGQENWHGMTSVDCWAQKGMHTWRWLTA